MEKETFKMYSIYSGNLRRIGWRKNNKNVGILRVEFSNGSQYDYFPVMEQKYKEIFKITDSKGKWFDTEIKKNPDIKYMKVPDKELTV